MDWKNPVEWVAWIYGKCFQNHAIVGGFVFVALFGLIGLAFWLRGVDKYKEEHPGSPQKQVVAEAAGRQEESNKETHTKSQAQSSQVHTKKDISNRKAKVDSGGAVSTPGIVVQPGGAVSFGQQGGITAGTVNINQAPPLPSLSDHQQSTLHAAFSAVAGGPIRIVVDIPTDETDTLAQRLRAALSADGTAAPDILRVHGLYVPPSNCQTYRGIWMIVGENRMDTANAIAVSLGESGVVQGRVNGCTDIENPDKLTIVISSN